MNHADNGVFLCHKRCHYWFDRLHWWLDDDLNVAATDALLADEDEGPFFQQFVGRPLQRPRAEMARHWPTPQTWAVQRRRCMEKTAERRRLAAGCPFDCDKCGERFTTTRGLTQHVDSCAETQKRLLVTPAVKGAREPDGDNDADDDEDDDDNDDGTDDASSGLDESGSVPALSAVMSALNVAAGAVSALRAQFGDVRRSARLAVKAAAAGDSAAASAAGAAAGPQ